MFFSEPLIKGQPFPFDRVISYRSLDLEGTIFVKEGYDATSLFAWRLSVLDYKEI